jgi:hypothetical protein
MLITDTVTLADARVNADGYLEAVARTARAGVQQYRGAEVGKPDLANVNVFRDETEVFAKASLDSFAHIPITVDHPAEPVNAGNWKKYAAGTTGGDVLRDGEHLKIGLRITDAAAVKAVQNGKRELSVGYSTELVWGDGVAPDGTAYQAKQTAIVANHIAIVSAGRAGPQCRIGDSWSAFSTEQKDAHMTLKTITVDGIPVEVTDQGAIVIATLQSRLTDAKTASEKLVTDHAIAKDKLVSDHAGILAAKDADLAKKDAEIDGLKAKIVEGAALDALVQARGDLIAKAKAIAPAVATDGKSDAQIRHGVVAAKIGDAAVKDKPAAYIDARFDILVEDAKLPDPVRDAINGGIKHVGDARQQSSDAWDKGVTDLNAWRKEA